MLTAPTLAARLDALLPQTQCTQCGYAGCMPYADAMAAGEAANRCPPGGQDGADRLAALLGRPPLPLDASRGPHLPHRVAVIDAARCIGCAKCLAPCPTDAIVGASRALHAVASELCTGCELCLPPCPVDCISMVEDPAMPAMLPRHGGRDGARQRYQSHLARLDRDREARARELAARERAVLDPGGA